MVKYYEAKDKTEKRTHDLNNGQPGWQRIPNSFLPSINTHLKKPSALKIFWLTYTQKEA